ncbi:hypothetical protein Sdia_43770 [Streptomyces diastaticus subsp. diastaticus]|uniref:Uncharacterized protein n=1 Tax=Streptomyces diastaticus subsp. diastaticus TaxID=68040 RepID=A0ABQ1CTT4_STRDI|nr:hypothetical protein Sdia_43770 [Streptomyces diastaticus subsp. diastaticus]GGU08416.1 hypothetical protein GCM10015534_08200 [Streptomyces diastaticus subsp. diastaticus]
MTSAGGAPLGAVARLSGQCPPGRRGRGLRQTSVSAPGRSPRLGFFRDGRSPLTAAPADGPHRSREAARAGDPHSAPARRPPAPVGGALREATRTEAGLRLTARLPPPS